jgi:acyl dehydratase
LKRRSGSGLPPAPASPKEGPFYEDFEPGKVIHHPTGRTITDTDNIWFTLLTCNTNQIHFNKDYAARNYADPPFNGKLVVNSLLTFAIVLGLSVSDTSKNGIMLGMTDWKALRPVFAGDTIYSQSRVIDKRESNSHPNMGLVTILTRGLKQDGTVVVEFKRTFMVRKSQRVWK